MNCDSEILAAFIQSIIPLKLALLALCGHIFNIGILLNVMTIPHSPIQTL